jgi:threonine synthase
MRIPFVHNPLVVFVGIGLIVISTAVLSFVSYRYTVGRENLVETSLNQTNDKLATQYVDRIEQKIVENDAILSKMIDVDEPTKWPEMVEEIKNSDSMSIRSIFCGRTATILSIRHIRTRSGTSGEGFAPASR